MVGLVAVAAEALSLGEEIETKKGAGGQGSP